MTTATSGSRHLTPATSPTTSATEWSTPKFAFITPNLCDDGHDATCAGTERRGHHRGGLIGADLWLKPWMPLILNSPAYRSGSTLVDDHLR